MKFHKQLKIYIKLYEIKQRVLIDMAADRGAYICQSQSLNLFLQEVDFAKLTSMHFYTWKKGLKTGMYYLRTKAAADAIKFTVQAQADVSLEPVVPQDENPKEIDKEREMAAVACSLENKEDCVMCSG